MSIKDVADAIVKAMDFQGEYTVIIISFVSHGDISVTYHWAIILV